MRDAYLDGFDKGAGGRRIGFAQKGLVEAIGLWLDSHGGVAAVAAALQKHASLFAKYLTCEAALPESTVQDWFDALDVADPEEQRDITAAFLISNLHRTMLEQISLDWPKVVADLCAKIEEYARKRADRKGRPLGHQSIVKARAMEADAEAGRSKPRKRYVVELWKPKPPSERKPPVRRRQL